jgi:hypothetical protein
MQEAAQPPMARPSHVYPVFGKNNCTQTDSLRDP